MATVLVVDDNATNRALLAKVLQRDGHRVIEASNGAEGLGLAWLEQPDLVLTDVVMPRVDGYALDRELRTWSRTADIPVIFHTATYTATEIQQLVGDDRRAVLPKPSDLDVISKTVASMLETSPRADDGASAGADEQVHLDLLNAKLMQQVRELELAARERQRLLASLVRAQEDERELIAGEIHDDPVQAMTAVAMRLELLDLPVDDPVSRERIDKLLATVRTAITRLRRLIFQLHPPALDTDGLAGAVDAFLAHVAGDVDLSYVIDDRLSRDPEPALRSLLYRVIQEALTNVTKHADARTVRVELREEDDGFLAVVADDGSGFVVEGTDAPRPGHLGLVAMRQRVAFAGGSLRLESEPGAGTTVRVWVPTGALEPVE